MKRFAIIGVAGYVAPRHLRAINDTGNRLAAALDVSDSVGIIDSYAPDARFFTEFERFDRHLDLQRRKGQPVDYVSICSPNYLHDAHVRFALRSGANAICEKPLVLNPWNIDGLIELERESGKTVNTILQLRLHPSIKALRDAFQSSSGDRIFDVDLIYITSRGRWYLTSWKGNEAKSGGVATNIGVHFFDVLHFIFGPLRESVLHYSSPTTAAGFLDFGTARVRWFMSTDSENLPDVAKQEGKTTYRSLTIDGEEVEFSAGFTDLHTESYKKILAGEGFGLEENRAAIEIVSSIRRMEPVGLVGDYHPHLQKLKR